MNLSRWEPIREFEEMFRRYSPLPPTLSRSSAEVADWMPVADISETDKEYLVKVQLPDVSKEDVKVTLDDGVLTISGERKREKREENENDIRVESFYGAFSRSFSLPDDVDAENIRAEHRDGVLRVHVPKAKPSRSKPLSIKVN